jgi:hypothetical protein
MVLKGRSRRNTRKMALVVARAVIIAMMTASCETCCSQSKLIEADTESPYHCAQRVVGEEVLEFVLYALVPREHLQKRGKHAANMYKETSDCGREESVSREFGRSAD